MALTRDKLAEALRLTSGGATPAEHQDAVDRLLAVSNALVMQYAPDAPETVRDEAQVRIAGYLFDRPPETPSAGAVFYSGAQGLLQPWRKVLRNAEAPAAPAVPVPEVPVGPSQPVPPSGGGLTEEERADLRASIPYDGPSFSDRDLVLPSADGRVREITVPLPPATRLVPAVGQHDVGRILTAPAAQGGQPTWNSNPGQTAAQVAAKVLNDIQTMVRNWARGLARIPESALPSKVDDFADALNDTAGFQDEGSDAATDAWVGSAFATEQEPSNIGADGYQQSFSGPRYTNVWAKIRRPNAVPLSELRLAIGSQEGGDFQEFDANTWHQVGDAEADYTYYTQALANVPATAPVRVQRFIPITIDGPKVGIEDWATVDGPDVPRDRIQGGLRLFKTLINSTIGIAFNTDRNARQNFTSFNPILEIADDEHGVILVQIDWQLPSSASNARFKLGDDVSDEMILYLSRIRASDEDVSLSEANGIRVGEVDVLTGTVTFAKRGEVSLYFARKTINAKTQVGYYLRYESSSHATAQLNQTVQAVVEATLLRTDATTATPAPADDSITTAKIKDGAVTNPKLGRAAVRTFNIFNGNVVTDSLANLAVTTAKLANLAVTSAKLANGAVSVSKLAAAVVARIAPALAGNGGKWLKVNAAASALEFADAPSGGGAAADFGGTVLATFQFASSQTRPIFSVAKATMDGYKFFLVRTRSGWGNTALCFRSSSAETAPAFPACFVSGGTMTPGYMYAAFGTDSDDSTKYKITCRFFAGSSEAAYGKGSGNDNLWELVGVSA